MDLLTALKNSIKSERDFVDLLSLQLRAMEYSLEKHNPQAWKDYQFELYRLLQESKLPIPQKPDCGD